MGGGGGGLGGDMSNATVASNVALHDPPYVALREHVPVPCQQASVVLPL